MERKERIFLKALLASMKEGITLQIQMIQEDYLSGELLFLIVILNFTLLIIIIYYHKVIIICQVMSLKYM